MKEKEIVSQLNRCLAETIGIKEEEISLNSSIIDDLGADSLDLLDLVFRLEQAFKIRISRGEIETRARETMPEEDFETDGLLSEKAKKALRKALPEVDSLRFKGNLRKSEIPRLLTVQTFLRLVKEKMEAKDAA
ncbi:acyl carrier protein [Candidatus Pacearchaeota archaeon]|jgi:acyl carrier protein|nr:acyl carrier protein [Candidatus Pacearchaeota archaeon]